MRSPKPGVISLITLAVCLAAAYPSAAQMAGEPHLPPLYRFPDGHYVLADTLRYKINGHNFVIPPGFVNDLASIPRKSAGFLPRDTRHDIPGIVHDWLYWRQELPKKDADELFRRMLMDMGYPESVAGFGYVGVRNPIADIAWKTNCSDRKALRPRIIPSRFMRIPARVYWEGRGGYREYLQRKQVVLDQTSRGHCVNVPGSRPNVR